MPLRTFADLFSARTAVSAVAQGTVALLALTTCTGPAAVAQEFPYFAHVRAETAHVRSGPGKNYYPTGKLLRGEKVQVWRHDPGGWYAVRPPQGSYSWISARHCRKLPDGLGVITDDAVDARVGSNFSNVRDVVQVRLERGEKVEILDDYNGGGQTWYKIAAPAGEFRWVSADDLASEHSKREARSAGRQNLLVARIEEPRGDEVVTIPDGAMERPTRSSAPEEPKADDAPARDGTAATTASAGDSQADEEQISADNGKKDSDWRKLGEGELERGLADIEWEVAAIVAEEPKLWSFEYVQEQLQEWKDRAETSRQRALVRQMQAKISKLESIHERYDELRDEPALPAPPDDREALAELAALRALSGRNRIAMQSSFADRGEVDDESSDVSGIAAETPAAAVDQTRTSADAGWQPAANSTSSSDFDGRGVLRPVISKRLGAPRFALVDDEGHVLTFVTPSPGMNLHPYVGQKIGIAGLRGFMPEYRKPHLTARRVTPLALR